MNLSLGTAGINQHKIKKGKNKLKKTKVLKGHQTSATCIYFRTNDVPINTTSNSIQPSLAVNR